MTSPVPQPPKMLMYSPPPKKRQQQEQQTSPSEFLILKPFSKTPTIQIEVPKPGKSKAALLSVQNIDDNASRVYFEIPADKKILIQPETLVIQPQSVELFEIIAVEPKESFRATIKIFAPGIKFYRGGQFYVSIDVQKAPKVEKKKRQKPTVSVVKPKSVTVPKEFKFQPSREERKKGLTKNETQEQEEVVHLQDPIAEHVLDDTSTDLENIRRQTVIRKHLRDSEQTYLVSSPVIPNDFNDPLTFVKQELGSNNSLESVAKAVMKYVDFAKTQNSESALVTERQKQSMNRILLQQHQAMTEGSVCSVLSLLQTEIPTICDPSDSRLGSRMSEQPQAGRIPTKATSSPKWESSEGAGGEEEQRERSAPTVTLNLHRLTPDQCFSQESTNDVKSPDVSAIFPISLGF